MKIKNQIFLFLLGVVIFLGFSAAGTLALTLSPVIAELSGDPGETLVHTFKATNETRESKIFYLDFQSFEAKDESGNPALLKVRSGLPTWMQGPESVTLGPNETQELTVQINIPQSAEPGGNFAAILLRSDPPRVVTEDVVSIASQLGTMVLLRVKGDFQEGGDILEFDSTSKKHWFRSLPVDFYYRFQNSGVDWAKPLGDIVIENIWGGTAKIVPANPMGANVLPNSIRRFESSWVTRKGEVEDAKAERPPGLPDSFWERVKYQVKYSPFGRYTAALTITHGSQQQRASKELVFWIAPWEMLSVAVPSILVLLFILRFGIKRYNRLIIAREKKRKMSQGRPRKPSSPRHKNTIE